MTQAIVALARRLGIAAHDRIIVGKEGRWFDTDAIGVRLAIGDCEIRVLQPPR
jgi:hypothetical protein